MSVYWTSGQVTLHHGDVIACLRELPEAYVHCVVTSPPYWGLRDYGIDGQIGLEETPEAYVQRMVEVFREVRRVLRADGTCWLNLGDSYAANWSSQRSEGGGGFKDVERERVKYAPPGLKSKDLIGIPWRVALALQADGWWLRSEITWCKRAPMPESVTDRPTSATEKVFLLAKSERYFYDQDAIREAHTREWFNESVGPKYMTAEQGRNDGGKREGSGNPGGRNMRNWWALGPEPYPEAHFATFPTEIPRRAILAGTSERGCCAECGAPWVRVVERTGVLIGEDRGGDYRGRDIPKEVYGQRRLANGERYRPGSHYETVARGWAPICAHDVPAVPCTVLDPFIGSGTTCMVATQLGRRSIGIDLNAEYLKLAIQRNQQLALEVPA